LKLNSGLVDIISGFLTSESLRLDCVALASLSDISRAETKDSLTRLRHRLSQPTLDPTFIQAGRLCDHLIEEECCTNKYPAKETSPLPSNEDCRKPVPRKPKHSDGSKVVIAPINDYKKSQWGMVRNRPHRKRRTTSTSSGGSTSSTDSKGNKTSPLANRPQSSPPVSGAISDKSRSKQTRRSDTTRVLHCNHVLAVAATPGTKQPARLLSTATNPGIPLSPKAIPLELPFKPPKLRPIPPPEVSSELTASPSNSVPIASSPDQANHLVTTPRRRQDKRVESFYSFASDSTKLGEIPLHKWVTPFDFDTMDSERSRRITQLERYIKRHRVQRQRTTRFAGENV